MHFWYINYKQQKCSGGHIKPNKNDMKKILLLLSLVLGITYISYAQKVDTTYVIKYVDEMTDQSSLFSNRKLIIANDTKTIGFTILVTMSKYIWIYTNMVGLGSCNENDELIILLENGNRIKLTSRNDFNCKGDSYFVLTNDDILRLRLSPISKIRITNGRTFDNYTGEVEPQDKYYFIQLFNSYSIGNYQILK